VLVQLGKIFGWQPRQVGAPADGGVASVLGKAGEILGGEDIDHWLLDDALQRHQLTRQQVAGIFLLMKQTAEETNLRLAREEPVEFSCFDPDALRTYSHTYTRTEFENLLEQRDFFVKIQNALQSALRQSELKGVGRGSLTAVVLTGGTSQMPAAQRAVRQNFGRDLVRAHKPFEAVAHGALHLARGTRVEDFIYHSYGIRGWNSHTRRHEYDLIIPAGQKYPTPQPIERRYPCSAYQQSVMELPVGEMDHGSERVVEVIERGGRIETVGAVTLNLHHYPTVSADRVVPVNARAQVVPLNPPGNPGLERIRALFRVDAQRTLRVTVEDLQTRRRILDDAALVQLR
jgi:molecular chaperone DnaK (HSP70)